MIEEKINTLLVDERAPLNYRILDFCFDKHYKKKKRNVSKKL